jgi:hypothetical protein
MAGIPKPAFKKPEALFLAKSVRLVCAERLRIVGRARRR